jgi:hypothetical protein
MANIKLKIYSVLILTFVLLFCANCSNNSTQNLFDKADGGKVYVNRSDRSIKLQLIEEITEYTDPENNICPFTPRAGSICYKDSIIYILPRFEQSIIGFKLDEFHNGSKYIKYTQKESGKGPNEFIQPSDIVYDNKRDLIYIADLNNFCIYCYNKDLHEVDRVMLETRAYKISISDNYLYITNYTYTFSDYCVDRIDLNTRELVKGLFPLSNQGSQLEKNMKNAVHILAIDEEAPLYIAARQYPKFNLYFCNEDEVLKTFSSPSLYKKRLPKPKRIVVRGDRKTWGLNAFVSLDYSKSKGLIFALTTNGWGELAEEKKLDRYILIFDEEGNTLCEHKITPYEGGENKICFDEKNNILYYFSSESMKIRKYKLEYK